MQETYEAKNEVFIREKKKEYNKKDSEKPVYQPPSTKKWEAALERTKIEREKRENLLREKEKQDLERQTKAKKVKFKRKNHEN